MLFKKFFISNKINDNLKKSGYEMFIFNTKFVLEHFSNSLFFSAFRNNSVKELTAFAENANAMKRMFLHFCHSTGSAKPSAFPEESPHVGLLRCSHFSLPIKYFITLPEAPWKPFSKELWIFLDYLPLFFNIPQSSTVLVSFLGLSFFFQEKDYLMGKGEYYFSRKTNCMLVIFICASVRKILLIGFKTGFVVHCIVPPCNC